MKKEYIRNFTKTVYGYARVEANNKKEAEELLDSGEADEFDNSEDHEWTSEIMEN